MIGDLAQIGLAGIGIVVRVVVGILALSTCWWVLIAIVWSIKATFFAERYGIEREGE
jgi:hypothetical protein